MIEINNITKRYNTVTALDNLSLKVDKGELFGLLGPNGAGKTTLLKIISGIIKQDEGEILFKNTNLNFHDYEIKKKIAYIPEQPNIFPYLSGVDFLYLVKSIFSIDDNTFNERLKYYTDYFNMNEYMGSLIKSYSHGMRQKLIFVSAFIHEPEYIIIDEPMVGLDPISIRLVKNELKMFTEKKSTVIMSTHTVSVAEEICSRIGIINNGRLSEEGSVSDITGKYNKNLENIFLELI